MSSKLPDLSAIDITPVLEFGTNLIRSYSQNSVTINETKYEHSIIVSGNKVTKFSSLDDIKDIDIDRDTIILFGSIDDEKKEKFSQYITSWNPEVMFESMSFSAACRTYNVLIQEARKVYAILDLDFIYHSEPQEKDYEETPDKLNERKNV